MPAAAVSSLLLFSGCLETPTGAAPGNKLLDEFNNTVMEIHTDVKTVKGSLEKLEGAQKTLDEKNKQGLQAAADRVRGAIYVNAQNDAKNPYTELTGEELGIAVTYLPLASDNNEARIIADLNAKRSNDQQQIAELKKRQAAAMAEAIQAREERKQAEIAVGEAKAEVKQTTEKLDNTVVRLDDAEERAKRAKALADDAAAQAEKERNAKARLHIAYGFMAVGGLLIVAAIVATVLHVPGVLVAGLASGGALVALGWIITVLNEWLQNIWFKVGLGAVLLGALAFGVLFAIRAFQTRRKADMDAKIGEGAIGALQEARNDDAKLGRKAFAGIEPYLKEWFVDDDGNPDVKLDKALKQRLVKMNLINPAGATAHVVRDVTEDRENGEK